MFPSARKQNLIVEKSLRGLTIYDKRSYQVHSLNHAVAAVWEHADGSRSVDDLVHTLRKNFDATSDKGIVHAALHELHTAGLLTKEGELCFAAELLSMRGDDSSAVQV
jgi:DNA-binding response OmpR family regulator